MRLLTIAVAWTSIVLLQQPPALPIPSSSLKYREFTMRFAPAGAFELQGVGYPTFKGTWKRDGNEVEIVAPDAGGACPQPARYRIRQQGQWTLLDAVKDPCEDRVFFLDRSTWLPEGVNVKDVMPARAIVRSAAPGP